MPAFAAIFGKIVGLMGKKSTLTSMKAFNKTMETFKVAGHTATQVRESLEKIGGSPIVSAFQYLIAQFKEGTVKTQLELFNELMELFKNPVGKLAIGAFVEVFSFILQYQITIIKWINFAINAITGNLTFDYPSVNDDYIPGLTTRPPGIYVDPVVTPGSGTTVGGIGTTIGGGFP
jgi:hypothetical protein